jgi:hypothetical protein
MHALLMETHMINGKYAPSQGEIFALCNGLLGWRAVRGLGPDYFASRSVESALVDFVTDGKPLSTFAKRRLAQGRTCVTNFFTLINDRSPAVLKSEKDYVDEVECFLTQLGVQVQIWKESTFAGLDFSRAERHIYLRTIAKVAPVLFNMGFADAIPHAGQVSRLTASMANSLHARPSQILQAAIVGFLHDPKFHPGIDLEKQNLATHPVVAAAIAYAVFRDRSLLSSLRAYFHGNTLKVDAFIEGIIDALAVNNDSRFVQMFVMLPTFVKRIGDRFGEDVAANLRSVMERRLESASKGIAPPSVPQHLHGCLEQIAFDSGLRGLNRATWANALQEAGITTERPKAVFCRIIAGKHGRLTTEQFAKLRSYLSWYTSDHLSVRIRAADLLHHHQEVSAAGAKAAAALVIADPMMLSCHKVASVHNTAVIDRLNSYVQSFDDNTRLLPLPVKRQGHQWQRAVYMAILHAADSLTGQNLLGEFLDLHQVEAVDRDIEGLRTLILHPGTWGEFAQAAGSPSENELVKRVLAALETSYIKLVNQYRQAVYEKTDLNHFRLQK